MFVITGVHTWQTKTCEAFQRCPTTPVDIQQACPVWKKFFKNTEELILTKPFQSPRQSRSPLRTHISWSPSRQTPASTGISLRSKTPSRSRRSEVQPYSVGKIVTGI